LLLLLLLFAPSSFSASDATSAHLVNHNPTKKLSQFNIFAILLDIFLFSWVWSKFLSCIHQQLCI
jgi:hypothetical protein